MEKFSRLISLFKYIERFRVRKNVDIIYDAKVLKPIFIIGVPRSGTTLLYRILCKHPDLAWFSHDYLKQWMTKQRQSYLNRYYTKLKNQNKKIPKSEESLFVFGTKQRKPLEGTSRIPIEAATFWQIFLDSSKNNISEDTKSKLLTIIYNAQKDQKKSRFVNKSPYLNKKIFLVHKIFPDAKFIYIIRDPRSVISSALVRFEKEGKFSIDGVVENPSIYKKFDFKEKWAYAYKEITEIVYKFFTENKNNMLTIQYEKLLEQPEETIKNLLEFCELEIPENIKEIIPSIRDTTDKWKNNLTVEDEQKIFKIIGESLRKMNYSYSLGSQ